ncbi:type II toxin-antitoxin system PemK/MazF family toxin [Candidatus Saccharibacteria bacterium]|nr:type II toxin-antitoxin system PemK/MazF family toxin [Candidatus Saccharibacteria bacterium]
MNIFRFFQTVLPKTSRVKRYRRKRFRIWARKKVELEFNGRQTNFHEGEIYWAGIGQNIGSEIYGKGDGFARPVLIYRKLGKYNFLAIPLTSKEHVGTWYISFYHRGRKETAVLSQIRVLSPKRLYRKMGQIDNADYIKIRKAFRKLY